MCHRRRLTGMPWEAGTRVPTAALGQLGGPFCASSTGQSVSSSHQTVRVEPALCGATGFDFRKVVERRHELGTLDEVEDPEGMADLTWLIVPGKPGVDAIPTSPGTLLAAASTCGDTARK